MHMLTKGLVADFQTKAFTKFNAQGSAYELIGGDSQWLGAASEADHYADLSDFVKENNVLPKMAPGTMKYYSDYPASSCKYWSIPTEGDGVRKRPVFLRRGTG